MRKIMILFAFAIGGLSLMAQPIVTLQSSSTSSFYDNLDAAINDASAGDLIVLSGGSFYITDTINKGVSIIGAGHFPDSSQATGISIITSHVVIGEGADNMYLDGLFINGDVVFPYEERSDNVMIKRCNLNNLTFGGSHFSQYDSDTLFPHNASLIHSVVRNNIVAGGSYFLTLKGNVINGRVQNAIHGGSMENNIFLKQGTATYQSTFDEVRGYTVKNNIFFANDQLDYGSYSCYNPPCGTYNNSFQNNLFMSDSVTVELFDGVSLIHVNNIYGVTDIFVNQSGNLFDYTHDYHLTLTSPGNNAGLDGTDVGIFGGSDPMKEGGMPIIPWIVEKNIAPSSNGQGELPVYIKVKAQEK